MRISTGRSVLFFVGVVVFFLVALALADTSFSVSVAGAWPPDGKSKSEMIPDEVGTSPTIWVLDQVNYLHRESIDGEVTDIYTLLPSGAKSIQKHIEWPIWTSEPPIYVDHEAKFNYPAYILDGQRQSFWLSAEAEVTNAWFAEPYEYWMHYAAHTTSPYYYNEALTCPYGVSMIREYDDNLPNPVNWHAQAVCMYTPDEALWSELAATGADQFSHNFSGRTGWLSDDQHYFEFYIPLTYRRCADLTTCPVEARMAVQSQGDGWVLNDQPLEADEPEEVVDGDELICECNGKAGSVVNDWQTCSCKPVKIRSECAEERKLAWDTVMLFFEPFIIRDPATISAICDFSTNVHKCETNLVLQNSYMALLVHNIVNQLVKCSDTLTNLLYGTTNPETYAPEVHLIHEGGMLRYKAEHPNLELTVETGQVSVVADGPSIFAVGNFAETNETFAYAIKNAVTIEPKNAQQPPFILEPDHLAIIDPESVDMVEVSYDVYLPSVVH